MVESDFFITNDGDFIKAARESVVPITVCRVSELPFLWKPM